LAFPVAAHPPRQLPPRCRELLSLLARNPPLTYAEIGVRMGMPTGGLGSGAGAVLAELRRCPPLVPVIDAGTGILAGGEGHDEPLVER